MSFDKVKISIKRWPLLSTILRPVKIVYWQALDSRKRRRIQHRQQCFGDFRKQILHMSLRPGATFVKIGANDGVTGDPCSDIILANSNWRGLLIEPVPYCCDRLKKNFPDASRFSIAQVAIGTMPGNGMFYYVHQSASAHLSSLPPWYDQLGSFNKNHIIKRFGPAIEPYIVESKVATCTLPDILAQYTISHVDLLHVDTEGYDLEILKMVDFARCAPRVIFIEHRHLAHEERVEMLRLLRRNKYIVRDCGYDYYARHKAADSCPPPVTHNECGRSSLAARSFQPRRFLRSLWRSVKIIGWYVKRPRICLNKMHHGIDKLFFGAFNLTSNIMWWYAKRPHLWKSMWHEMRRPASNPRNKTGERASAWCGERALNSYAELPGIGANLGQPSLERLFPDVFKNSHRIARECPVVMGGPGHLDLLYGYAEYLQATRVLETGVAYGWSSLALLLSLSKRPPARLVSIDRPYPLLENDSYVGCVVPEELRRNWTLLKCADRNGLPKALKILGGLDLCHYDSDKSYDGRMWAYPLLWKALRPGGVFISDDVGDNLAFCDFVQQVDCSAYILRKKDKGYAGVLVKPEL